MREKNVIVTTICLFFIVSFSSCQTTKNTSQSYKYARQPKFIKGIYLNGHNKSNATVNAIEPARIPVTTPMPEASVPEIAEKTDNTITKSDVAQELPISRHEQAAAPAFDLVSDNLVQMKYADMIGVEGKDITNHQLYRFIDKWYGTNYRMGGHTLEGIDCSSFSQKLYEEVYGLDLTRTAMEQFQNCKRDKNCENAEEGDLVFFRQRSKRISHVGVYLGNDYFVHASTSLGVTISNLKEEYWHRHYAGIGKVAKGN